MISWFGVGGLWFVRCGSVEIASSIFHGHSIHRSVLLSRGGRLRVSWRWLDIMGTILSKPKQAFGEGLVLDN